ncbi:hypothetical protein BLA39750_07880 [Burkholderia lata]|uniref:Uncharacterized protein n=1 Tax=Burkholderia lata (strain ATCC 17760 / DSM 23089 / LMG 22485 / NCIMB 9086 / R18194 / 383) TaxID=482957 RepID=A0A6P3CA03_BURL3|nr:hypothetical protein BLA39750_07880 [Burkholderia lata]
MNAANSATASASLPSVAADSQPCDGAPISAAIAHASAAPNSRLPAASTRFACGSRDSSIATRAPAASSRQTGRFSRNTQRQPIHCVIAPPTSGAMAVAIPMHMPQIAHARARSRPSGKRFAITASAAVSSSAAPPPFTARAAISQPADGATPQPSDARKNSASPVKSIRLRPKRSASPPAGSRQAANAVM